MLKSLWPSHLGPIEEWIEQWTDTVSEDDADQFLADLKVTKAVQRHLYSVDQRTAAWHKARSKRLTGSRFGAAAGVNVFCSPHQLLKDSLWPVKFSNAFTEYGTKMEPVAADLFEKYIQCKVTYPGLVVCSEMPYLAASPDGIVHLPDGSLALLEIKCPARKKFYPEVPPYYMAQIQGCAGLLGLKEIFFVTYVPDQPLKVERLPFDEDYFFNFLLPKLQEWYFCQYLPRAVLQRKGLLAPGKINIERCTFI